MYFTCDIGDFNIALWSMGLIPGRDSEGNFSLCHCIQTGCGAHPSSYSVGTGGFFPWG